MVERLGMLYHFRCAPARYHATQYDRVHHAGRDTRCIARAVCVEHANTKPAFERALGERCSRQSIPDDDEIVCVAHGTKIRAN